MYGCEVWSLTDNSLHKVVNVAWNNCFRRIFSCCWRESTRTLPISCLLDKRRLIFWYRMLRSDNPILYALSRLHQNKFNTIGCKYGIDLLSNSYVYVKEADVWWVFAGTVTLYYFFLSLFLCILCMCIVCILLCAANGVINDDSMIFLIVI